MLQNKYTNISSVICSEGLPGGVRECRGVAGANIRSGEGSGSSFWDPDIPPQTRRLGTAEGPAPVRGTTFPDPGPTPLLTRASPG